MAAAIDAALADNSIGPDAMRWAPDASEHEARLGAWAGWLPQFSPEALEEFMESAARARRNADALAAETARIMMESTRRAARATPADFALMPPPVAPLDTSALNRAFADVTETFRRAGEQLQAGGGLFKGFAPQVAIVDEVPAPEPLVVYEPDGKPFFAPYRAETALTMEAPGE
ncbi:hypothetical protein [Streptomonospora arabica]|uniref:hypothetical protein n=1 Tax=Streptomonospora arabica TaxID=412417 RepID=UPI0031E431AE